MAAGGTGSGVLELTGAAVLSGFDVTGSGAGLLMVASTATISGLTLGG